LVDYVVDHAQAKIGAYMPGTHLAIRHPDRLKTHPPNFILLLAWNLSASIMQKEAWFTKQGGKFIIPIPTPTVV
jgi:hypothetical protein